MFFKLLCLLFFFPQLFSSSIPQQVKRERRGIAACRSKLENGFTPCRAEIFKRFKNISEESDEVQCCVNWEVNICVANQASEECWDMAISAFKAYEKDHMEDWCVEFIESEKCADVDVDVGGSASKRINFAILFTCVIGSICVMIGSL